MAKEEEKGSLLFARENKVVLKISVAIFSGFLLQAATLIWWASWWASRLDYRVTAVEQQQAQNSQMIERVARVEEKVTNIQSQTTSIDNRLQALFSTRGYGDK